MAPFLGALAIIVLVVIGVWLVNLSRGDGLSEDERVGRAAVGQNDALQRRRTPKRVPFVREDGAWKICFKGAGSAP